jgi:glycosyltransferase involved in cell wall biosynthesis
MTISAIILTYNEQTRLRECLASAAWCDEVVVVDGHSTDDTVAVAREFTDKVFLSDRLGPSKPGGFAEQRNFGLEQVACEWAFFIDADERFTPELAKEIRQRLHNGIATEVAIFASVAGSISLAFMPHIPTRKGGRRECFVGAQRNGTRVSCTKAS